MSGKYRDLLTDYYTPGTIPLTEYPRPHFFRDSYLILNGVWDYAITKDLEVKQYDGDILVPFSPESILSGVKRTVDKDHYLFYHRVVTLPLDFRKEKLILHFGAVDQEVDVFINNEFVKSNHLPYLPFSIDITKHVNSDTFEIQLRVKDATRRGSHLIGKQSEKRGGIWYTAQSGIWQTVWLESLPTNYLNHVEIEPLFDEKQVRFSFDKVGVGEVKVNVFFANQQLYEGKTSKDTLTIDLKDIHPWSPDTPDLYQVIYTFDEDQVQAYFAFRKISVNIDKRGFKRFYLNDKPLFQSGILDQGYYSDGLLTPPSDQAMINDILLLKKMGFNMLRKHIKVEPLRFYYHCDRLGMLVWQDMICLTPPKTYNLNGMFAMFLGIHPSDQKTKRFGVTKQNEKNNYSQSLDLMIHLLKPFPSIVTWVPFNEGWGQFESKLAVDNIRKLDKTRLIDHASGWSDQKVGDYYSRHIYFTKLKIEPKQVHNRIMAISEFGGYSHSIPNHVFNPFKEFGYKRFSSLATLSQAFETLYMDQVCPLINQGLSAIIYTQLSDVEDEVNGLITYDRKVVKFKYEHVNRMNQQLYQTFKSVVE